MVQKVIIIGGGITGASTAYHLAKSGVETIIVDRKDVGQATDAAAGIVCPWLSQRRNKAWYRLAKGGARTYPDLIDELSRDGEDDTGYSRVGAISLHTDEKKLLGMQERAIKRREDAPEIGNITLLDAEQTQAMFPLLDGTFNSVHVSGAARVDGRKLRNSLLNGAQKHGATLLFGNATIINEGTRITGAVVNGNTIYADTVVAATGAWMGNLLKPLGVTFNVEPQRAQIMHLQVPGLTTDHLPVVMPPNNQYMLAFKEGRIVIGATHEDGAGFDHRVTAGGLHEILSKAIAVAPGLASSTVLETRVGFRPVTPGFLPVLGTLPGFKGLILANGLGASGLTMGPYIGEQLAKLVLDEELEINLTDYDIAGAIQ
ncbi:FAD-binding oxidoreductase [Virgibacillus sp. C22-A2]|uniref:FAD-binding oxidoreductase n=1 Tax=Virgibacillus tibetensis TaxID=3042313 RepID=A0ABU6KK36_9BACI|nr:FAD-binding oxidoreductase [Virgibacillus sp. C22-A2]